MGVPPGRPSPVESAAPLRGAVVGGSASEETVASRVVMALPARL